MSDIYETRPREEGKIDCIVGGFFGDEGKGEIVSYLVDKRKYSFSVRVGGDSAEHRFKRGEKEFTGRILPCAWVDPGTDLYLGAGHLFHIGPLKAEIEKAATNNEHPFTVGGITSRILIDRNAGIVGERHVQASKDMDRSKRGGSTFQGAGRAATHKVSRDGEFKTAEHHEELNGYEIGNVSKAAHEHLTLKHDGLIEGSQGALISLNHGSYPYCCAKDVTPAGLLAEAGIGIDRVRDIYAIYRAFPMRVPGESGPCGGAELSWSELEARLGYELDSKAKTQTLPDGSKGDTERVFEWDWDEFRESLILCSPTKLVFTFADWHHPSNLSKTKFEELHQDTQKFVHEMELMALTALGREVPVVLIRTGPKQMDRIER